MPVRTASLIDNGYPTVCNVTRYGDWKRALYGGPLLHVPTFWIYQSQPQIQLTQELAFDLALGSCKTSFQNLYNFKAGRNGPIDIQHSFKTMCTLPCLESDLMIQSIMTYTACSCLELSTQPNDPLYTSEGDLCQQNTARLLCDLVGYCGIWDCRIGDFMCPRYEFNKKEIPYKGKYGNCEKIFVGAGSRLDINTAVYSMTFMVVMLCLIFLL